MPLCPPFSPYKQQNQIPAEVLRGFLWGRAKHSFCAKCFPDGLPGSSVGSPLHVPKGTWVPALAGGERPGPCCWGSSVPGGPTAPPAGLSGWCCLWTSHFLVGRPPRRSSLGMVTPKLQWHDQRILVLITSFLCLHSRDSNTSALI